MTPLHPGDRLDHYQLEELVARSGMASIFRGTDLRSGARVAIKVPHPEAECDPVFFERFHREAGIGRELNHPGVIKVMKDDSPSRVYMAMEWADGRLLRHALAEQDGFAPERALRIAAAICDALDYTHSRGVVHRDLKPENIILGKDDRIKLIDFGIAGKAGARRLTFGKFSQIMGTADYISPEQVRGKRGDARSDIYALGVILYEMLTGKTPFRGTNPLAVMSDRLVNKPIPPRETAPHLSPQLEQVLYRALARDPEKRYRSAREFAYDLRHPDDLRPSIETPARSGVKVSKRFWFYSGVAMIPPAIFALMLYVASR